MTAPATGTLVRVEPRTAAFEFRQSNQSAAFLDGGDEEEDEGRSYIRQGQLLHAVFASIRQAGDLLQALARLRFEGVIDSDEQEQRIRQLATWALRHPQAQRWYDGSWELYNERTILYTDEDGQLQTRRPDRVMRKDGQVVVVDFKFGKPKEEHHRQVAEYMRLLADMGHTDIEGYLWYVFRGEMVKIQ